LGDGWSLAVPMTLPSARRALRMAGSLAGSIGNRAAGDFGSARCAVSTATPWLMASASRPAQVIEAVDPSPCPPVDGTYAQPLSPPWVLRKRVLTRAIASSTGTP